MVALPGYDNINGRVTAAMQNEDEGQIFYQFEHGNKDSSEKVIVRVKPSPRTKSP